MEGGRGPITQQETTFLTHRASRDKSKASKTADRAEIDPNPLMISFDLKKTFALPKSECFIKIL